MLTTRRDRNWSLILLVLCGAGCAQQPEEMLVGRWSADRSGLGMISKSIQLQNSNPDAAPGDVVAAAKALTSVAIEFGPDKTLTVYSGANSHEGVWRFDPAQNMIEIEYMHPVPAAEKAEQTEPAGAPAPADEATVVESDPAPTEAKVEWVAFLEPDQELIKLLMVSRKTLDAFGSGDFLEEMKNAPGTVKLRK